MSRRHLGAALIPVIGLGLASAPAAAQEAAQTPAPAAAAPSQPPADGPADRFGDFRGGQVQVSTGTDDDNWTFRVALPDLPSTSSRFSLSASTPLHGGDKAMPASLDALANGSRVTLGWGYFDVPVSCPDETQVVWERQAKRRCWRAPRRADNPDGTQCDVSSYAMRWYDTANYRRNQRRYPGATDFGIDATVGINEFEWVDPVTFGRQTARHTDWSLAGHVVHYLTGDQMAITGSISYQRAYEAADEQQLCPPNPGNPPTGCITARGAAPKRNEHLVLSLGLRYRLAQNVTLLNLAVAPQVNYDVSDDVWAVDVPVYFTPGANGSLTGGVRFGYRSDRENEFSVGAFVGTTFDIFGGGS